MSDSAKRLTSIRNLPNTMFAVYGPDHEHAGQPVERQATCACGRTFTQSLLATRELEAAERLGVLDRVLRQIPDGFVPVHCPPCERRDLSHQARIDDARGTASTTLPDRRSA
jgi:hypothetical protein